MNPLAERKWSTLLFNPFTYIAGGQALGLGVAAIVVAGVTGFASKTHFDGVLDTHVGAPMPFAFFLAEGFIDWLCLALVLLVFGKIISRTSFRIIDVLGTQALARWPTILSALITLPPPFSRYNHLLLDHVMRNPFQPPPINADAIYFFGATLFMLPLLVWIIALMYQSYSISCNVKGAKAVISFVLGLVLAEILSKIALHALM